MAETLPTEAPYTLRDISELLNYRISLQRFEIRRQSMSKPSYSPSEFHTLMCWASLNTPLPGRLSEEHAPSLPLYRRLMKAARREYESDLDSTLLPVILSDVIAETSKTLAEVWEMPADEFERLWNEKVNPPSKAPEPAPSPSMALGRFFDALAQLERVSNPTGPFSTDSNGNPSDPAQEKYARIQYYVLLHSQKEALQATPGYEAFRTFLLLEFGLPLVSDSRHKLILELLKRKVVSTVLEAEALPLEDVEELLQAKCDPSEGVDDLELLRAEVAALHVPGTSRTADGETVSKILGKPDLLQRIARYGKGTDRESLARFLHSCKQPKKKPGDDPT